MNILYVITGLGGGGAEKIVVELADKMHDLGHSVKIAYLKGEVVVKPRNDNIELIYLGLESLKYIKKSYRNYKELILKFCPDVVHSHMVHANIFARVLRKFIIVPRLICTAHSNNEGGRLRMLAYRLTHNMCEIMTNVSHSASTNFEKLGAVPSGQIRTIYNGIDLKKFRKNHESNVRIKEALFFRRNQPVFLAIGRFHEAKDYPNLIKAFSLVIRKSDPENLPHLLIVGDGEKRVEIEKQIFDLGLQPHVTLLGRRNDIVDLISIANFFVLSSSFEGFGLVVAEAMACETFVIATDCGGVKEVMGGYGLLVPPKSSEKLAQKLLFAIKMSDVELLENNKNALAYIKAHFDLEMVIQQWLEIYESK